MRVDTKTLLEEHRDLLHGSDCAIAIAIRESDNTVLLGCLMIAGLNAVGNYVAEHLHDDDLRLLGR